MSPCVVSVSARDGHGLGKDVQTSIALVAGEGVAGDAHLGETVKHRSRVAKDPTQPNLRQVHLIHAELLDEVAAKGFTVNPGELGENILTRHIDLLGLNEGAVLRFPSGAALMITGLRNPCHQLNGHSLGLMNALLDHCKDGNLIRKGGVMGIVMEGGEVFAGDIITLENKGVASKQLIPV